MKHFVACEISGKEDTVPLILNKYDPQLSIPAILLAKENDVSLITMPPHKSHKV